MSTNRLEQFFFNAGRIPRATLIFRLFAVAALCAAFGALSVSVIGDWGAGLCALLFVWCCCALSIQRLHDVGRSGYALFFVIIPVVGPLWLLTQLLKRGVEGRNRFGDNPVSRNDYLTVNIST